MVQEPLPENRGGGRETGKGFKKTAPPPPLTMQSCSVNYENHKDRPGPPYFTYLAHDDQNVQIAPTGFQAFLECPFPLCSSDVQAG